jgi:lipopolysaccharide/colanic/teichoic acid biosynthesis glycosyltransferase
MIKRIFDVIFSLFLLITLCPILSILALLVRIKLGSPVFFTQERVGQNEKLFTIKKFRTMTDAKDRFGVLLSDEERLTKFGRFLRSTSLDELPQLFNILKGDMSFVGPRPLLKEYLPLYTSEQKRRHLVKCGITGWAQVNGRNAISWEEKFKLDVWYIDHRSFLLDIKIILVTLLKVIRKNDIRNGVHATMPVFTGLNNKED